jgi:AcrR family transcriptional regulator
MTVSPPSSRQAGASRSRRGLSTREALVDATERLIAEKGLARLSIAEIARAADQRSRSATQYYFRSLEELALAVLERRGPAIRARRAAMLRELELAGRGHDIRAIVEAIVLPVTGLLGSSGAHFRAVAQLTALNAGDRLCWIHEVDRHSLAEWEARLHAELADIPETVRSLRIEMVHDLCTNTCANLEAKLERNDGAVDIAFASTALIDAVTAILTTRDNTKQP